MTQTMYIKITVDLQVLNLYAKKIYIALLTTLYKCHVSVLTLHIYK